MERILNEITIVNSAKILLIVVDGLGGVPNESGLTELESANLPNLDKLCKESLCGVIVPILEGITPGSAPAHLALFGYDPLKYEIGRGVLEALGLGIELDENSVACRCNFATIDYKNNIILDRRAGRISTERNKEICSLLQEKITEIDDVKITIKPAKEHRFVTIFTGDGLSDKLTDNDPLSDGKKPNEILPTSPEARKMANVVNSFLRQACEIIRELEDANYILLRGFSKVPDMPNFNHLYKLNSAAIATYPMYKGLAKLVGMRVLPTGESIEEEIDTLKQNYQHYDFFYFHIKKPDSLGEDGSFSEKVKKLEEIDSYIPEMLGMGFDVIAICGDHATPAVLKSHSWHYVPFILHSSRIRYRNHMKKFTELDCLLYGGLGKIQATDVMRLCLANSFKLTKFGP